MAYDYAQFNKGITYRIEAFGRVPLGYAYYQEWNPEKNGDREARKYAEGWAKNGFWIHGERTFIPAHTITSIKVTAES